MMGRFTILNALGALLFSTALAWADGPHWHVPNPDGDDVSPGAEGEAGKAANPANPPPAGGGGAAKGPTDFRRNPGNFLEMDDKCIDYYERHCVIQFSKVRGKEDFYLKIIMRCAQAMREVDTYLPCPDSYPLWHTEELRELMVEYAQRTWQRSTLLDPKTATACAELAVQCYVETVRFRSDSQAKALAGKLQDFFNRNQELAKLLEQAEAEQDQKKKNAILQDWRAKSKAGMQEAGLTQELAKAFVTFKLVTGDIPMLVDESEMRMMLALSRMGSIVLGPLTSATKNPSLKVQQAALQVIEFIKKRMTSPDNAVPTYSNVMNHLLAITRKAGSVEAQMAMKHLKAMGERALPFLVQIASNELLNLKQEALAAMKLVGKKSLGNDLEKWRAYANEVESKARPASPAQGKEGEGWKPGEKGPEQKEAKEPVKEESKPAAKEEPNPAAGSKGKEKKEADEE